jgi:hypothetical protein
MTYNIENDKLINKLNAEKEGFEPSGEIQTNKFELYYQ